MVNFKVIFDFLGLAKGVKEAEQFSGAVEKSKEDLKESDKYVDSLISGFKNISPQTRNIANNIEDFKTQISGAQEFIIGLQGGFTVLIAQARTLMLTLAPYALILGVVAGLVLTIQRAFQRNIGGLGTSWNKFMGNVKESWGKFLIGFDKLLTKLAPVFRLLGAILEGLGSMLLPIIDGFLYGLDQIITPISEVLGMLYTGGTFTKILIGSFRLLGNVIGASFKVAGFLLGKFIEGALFVGDIIFGNWGRAFERILNLIAEIIDLVPDFLLPEKVENWKNKQLDKASTQVGGGATTNNSRSSSNTITINTSRSIDKDNGQAFAEVLARQLSF